MPPDPSPAASALYICAVGLVMLTGEARIGKAALLVEAAQEHLPHLQHGGHLPHAEQRRELVGERRHSGGERLIRPTDHHS